MRNQLQLNLQDNSEYITNELHAIDPLLTSKRESVSTNKLRTSSRLSASVGLAKTKNSLNQTAKPKKSKWLPTSNAESPLRPHESQDTAGGETTT